MSKLQTMAIGAGALIAVAALATPASAMVYNFSLNPTGAGSIDGSGSYGPGDSLIFDYVIPTGFDYSFSALGSSTSGGPGTYMMTFTESSSGSYTYDLITDAAGVPEPAVWSTLILGLGVVGAALRRRRNVRPA